MFMSLKRFQIRHLVSYFYVPFFFQKKIWWWKADVVSNYNVKDVILRNEVEVVQYKKKGDKGDCSWISSKNRKKKKRNKQIKNEIRKMEIFLEYYELPSKGQGNRGEKKEILNVSN